MEGVYLAMLCYNNFCQCHNVFQIQQQYA
jgi:hypothetical protein